MEAKRTTQQVIDWLKAAEKRQQDWQQEVKKRWAENISGDGLICPKRQ